MSPGEWSDGGRDLASDLRGALARGELIAYFQPQFDVHTSKLVAVEALCRWPHPELGFVPAEVFIDIAEREGLIDGIGDFMLQEGWLRAAEWRERGVPLGVSVNVSPTQLTSAYAERVTALLTELGLPSGVLSVEVTESVPIVDMPEAVRTLDALVGAGVGVALDDYGTGHTSLSRLRELPMSELKIDRSLVQEATPQTEALIAESVELAHERGCRVVAEGIETQDQLDRVRALGCDRAQGYLFAAPMSKEDLEQLLLRA